MLRCHEDGWSESSTIIRQDDILNLVFALRLHTCQGLDLSPAMPLNFMLCSVTSDSFSISWTVACRAPLTIGFSRQGYWSWLLAPPPGDHPDPEIKHASPVSPALAGRFFTTEPLVKPLNFTVTAYKHFSLRYGSGWTFQYHKVPNDKTLIKYTLCTNSTSLSKAVLPSISAYRLPADY